MEQTDKSLNLVITGDKAISHFLVQTIQKLEHPVQAVETMAEARPLIADQQAVRLLIDVGLPEDQLPLLQQEYNARKTHETFRLIGIRTGLASPKVFLDNGILPHAFLAWPCKEEMLAAILGEGGEDAPRILNSEEKLEVLTQACSVITHTLNNPLTAILGQAQLALLTKPTEPEKIEKIFTTVEREAGRIRDFLSAFQELRAVVRDGILPDGDVEKLYEPLQNAKKNQ